MDITPVIPKGQKIIEAYGDGGFRISGARYEGSVLLLPGDVASWNVTQADAITEASLEPLFVSPAPIEVVLVGCGAAFTGQNIALQGALRKRGIGMEWMDTGAACRTYNVLLSEGRRVAAALVGV